MSIRNNDLKMENRDINSYTQVYLHDDFEKIQVHYRREVVLRTPEILCI